MTEKCERVTMRGADQPLRSLAEAFPEFYEALSDALECLIITVTVRDFTRIEEVIAQSRAVLKRMKGETP